MEILNEEYNVMELDEHGRHDVYRDGFQTLAEAEIALLECQERGGQDAFITRITSAKVTTMDLDARRVAEIMAAASKDGVA